MHARLMNLVMILLLACAIGELAYARWTKKTKVHSLRDTASSIAMGIGQQTLNLYLASSFLAVYGLVQTSIGIFAVSRATWWHWALLVVGCDLAFYCGHRTAHGVNLFVAGHVPHHQAEDFNLLSSLRQGWGAWVQMFPFYLPLAVLGVPIEMLVQGQIGIMVCQFLSHYGATSVRLGVLDRIFITPKNHRVHHGYGRRYGGRNCGGMLVVWDRLFGTYAVEDPREPVQVGSGLVLDIYDPIEAHLDYYRRILFVSRSRRGLVAKLSIWFQSPTVLYRELKALGYAPPSAKRAARVDARLVIPAIALCLALFAGHRVMFAQGGTAVRILTGAMTFAALLGLGALLSGFQPFAKSKPLAAPEAQRPATTDPQLAHPMSGSMRAA